MTKIEEIDENWKYPARKDLSKFAERAKAGKSRLHNFSNISNAQLTQDVEIKDLREAVKCVGSYFEQEF